MLAWWNEVPLSWNLTSILRVLQELSLSHVVIVDICGNIREYAADVQRVMRVEDSVSGIRKTAWKYLVYEY